MKMFNKKILQSNIDYLNVYDIKNIKQFKKTRILK